MGFGYCYLGLLMAPQAGWAVALIHTAAMLFAFLGSGLFVRYFNDFCDQEQDRRAGKYNIAQADTLVVQGLKLAGYSALIVIVLWLLSAPAILYILMGLQHVLYLIYSLPPIRLKERGWAGLICDAGYGHVVPAAVGFAFGYTAGTETPDYLGWYVALAALSQLAPGINNIIYHQLEDYKADKSAGVQTWVVRTGPSNALKLSFRWFAPLSLVSQGGYYLFLGLNGQVVLSAGLIGTLLMFTLPRTQALSRRTHSPKAQKLIATNELTEIWAPLYFLLGLVIQSTGHIALLLLHILGFRSVILPRAWQYLRWLRDRWKWLQGCMVYFYYHKLLILYARLKKYFFS